jgi:hypothetical protein
VFALINLKQSDLRRRIVDITTNLKSENLVHDLHEVMATGEVIRRELEDVNSK